ncbi:sulfurtransferase TusA family protein [Methylophaga sp.]|uniref:sulfurtransferase TusA family protein n=1 Tax=Methylophaga sp. TaxID=2024840 RepID=UPI0023B74C97
MSDITLVDLTLFGCPMHYIKAREALKHIALEESVDLLVNTGDAVDEVFNSLSQDGQECAITSSEGLTTTIRVRRKQ